MVVCDGEIEVEYLRTVWVPWRLTGEIGRRRAIPARDARRLAADGYVRIVEPRATIAEEEVPADGTD